MTHDEAVAAARLVRAVRSFTDQPYRADALSTNQMRKAATKRRGETPVEQLVRTVHAASTFLCSYRFVGSPLYKELDAAFENLFCVCTGTPPDHQAKRQYDGRRYLEAPPTSTGRPRGRPRKVHSHAPS